MVAIWKNMYFLYIQIINFQLPCQDVNVECRRGKIIPKIIKEIWVSGCKTQFNTIKKKLLTIFFVYCPNLFKLDCLFIGSKVTLYKDIIVISR